ncbi:MAG: hypothetical protein JSR53_14210 [Proteobacteria bacterium]|nr:hypothetical protein [Pseudomonadota bacterium]
MRGPGAYYNSGNLLGLGVGLWLQLASAGGDVRLGQSVLDYLAGNGSALAMSVATAVFLCSGELYHRAWPQDATPDALLNRIADLLSGIGALALGYALWLLGQPLLAATAGALHALGKLASAVAPDGHAAWPRWPVAWPDPFRGAVVLSRLPALLASGADLWRAATAALLQAESTLPIAMPLTLLTCYLLWTRADLLLFEGAGDQAGESTTPAATAGR